MKPYVVSNVFEQEDLDLINKIFENRTENNIDDVENNSRMGRLVYNPRGDWGEAAPNFANVVLNMFKDTGLQIKCWNIVEYNLLYGEPNLIPHYDVDNTELIFNFQVSSNTSWGVGVDKEVFLLEDNSAVVFNPNESIHWRPIKKFEPGEYVRMAFFRFWNENDPKEYSYLTNDPKSDVFDEINEIRNSL